MAVTALLPLPDHEELINEFVGKSLKDVATPAAVLDIGKLRVNCSRMLDAAEKLHFGWRAHIKTHKTTELTRLQVGETGPANIMVSTLIEAENVLPLMLEFKERGREANLLYSFPVTPAAVDRLSQLNKALGPNCLSLMVDHVAQLPSITQIYKKSSVAPSVFIKINMGGNRAGVIPKTEDCSSLISSVLSLVSLGTASLLGFYSHAGQSYSSNSSSTALNFLRQEFEALLVTAGVVHSTSPGKQLVLSVGATPTTTSVRNLLIDNEEIDSEAAKDITALRKTIDAIRKHNCTIEIHAGVYPTLDLQQLATNVLPTSGPNAMLTWSDLAFTVVAEVASIYPGRGKNGTPEALIGAGSLALGREPCKAYPGWGILTPWNRAGATMSEGGVEDFKGWQVGKVSQEHGILTWTGEGESESLEVGQKVRIWPNHACITGAGFGWYLIVDESREGREDEIIGVWPRWRGW